MYVYIYIHTYKLLQPARGGRRRCAYIGIASCMHVSMYILLLIGLRG